MKHTLTIDIGEKTCGNIGSLTQLPVICPFAIESHYNGTEFHCGLFKFPTQRHGVNLVLQEKDGMLMRNDECLSTLKPTEEKA